MSVASEITRIQNAKANLKTSINAKTDSEHQITNETIDEYADFVDSITSGGGDLDWSAIGYSGTPQAIVDEYNYALEIQKNWDDTITNLNSKYKDDKLLVFMPLVDTSNATNMQQMFYRCNNLTTIPLLDTSNVENMSQIFYTCANLREIPMLNTKKVYNFYMAFSGCTNLTTIPIFDTTSITSSGNWSYMFDGCINLSNKSLDNILQMCINSTNYSGEKTLTRLGFSSSNYPATRIQALPHYNDFINANWTIGY